MSEKAPDGIYVYQPYGVQHPTAWRLKRIYGVSGLPPVTTILGLTKREAEAVKAALEAVQEGEKNGKEETESTGRNSRA